MGRQNADAIQHGRALGSFEDWGVWVRDPLVALGCRDPVDRISVIKARDPERQRVISLFSTWHDAHGNNPVKVTELAETVRLTADPNNRGRQYLARTIGALAGTRLGGFVLERMGATNNRKEGARYRLLLSGFDSNASASSASASASAGNHHEYGATSEDIIGQNPCSADDADDADAFQAFPKSADASEALPKSICVQCAGGPLTDPPTDPPTEMTVNGKTVWVHPECRRFYVGSR